VMEKQFYSHTLRKRKL